MTVEYNIDIGQLVLSFLLTLLAIIAFFIKKEIVTFGKRLDRHESIIIDLVGKVQNLVGFVTAIQGSWNGKTERRRHE